jgi:hypothetical protein
MSRELCSVSTGWSTRRSKVMRREGGGGRVGCLLIPHCGLARGNLGTGLLCRCLLLVLVRLDLVKGDLVCRCGTADRVGGVCDIRHGRSVGWLLGVGWSKTNVYIDIYVCVSVVLFVVWGCEKSGYPSHHNTAQPSCVCVSSRHTPATNHAHRPPRPRPHPRPHLTQLHLTPPHTRARTHTHTHTRHTHTRGT